jgi:hypothetical protein
LFVTDKDWNKLNEDKAMAFHNIIAKILFATKHCHQACKARYLHCYCLPYYKSLRAQQRWLV